MHYAEFAEDESQALLSAIKDYENNKWKTIGQKVGKPAKVSHFSRLIYTICSLTNRYQCIGLRAIRKRAFPRAVRYAKGTLERP